MNEERKSIMTECYDCIHRREVAGNAHIRCAKTDLEMTGDPHGIKNGWFFYPLLFDPVWKTKKCTNFEAVPVSGAISQAMSQAARG